MSVDTCEFELDKLLEAMNVIASAKARNCAPGFFVFADLVDSDAKPLLKWQLVCTYLIKYATDKRVRPLAAPVAEQFAEAVGRRGPTADGADALAKMVDALLDAYAVNKQPRKPSKRRAADDPDTTDEHTAVDMTDDGPGDDSNNPKKSAAASKSPGSSSSRKRGRVDTTTTTSAARHT